MNYTLVTFILNYQKTIKSNWELLFQSASSREKCNSEFLYLLFLMFCNAYAVVHSVVVGPFLFFVTS